LNALDRALQLAGIGLTVFPCRANKFPATEHGFKDGSNDPHQIRSMWRRCGGALIGVPTGIINDVDVVDIDPRHGGDSWLTKNAERIPVTRIHSTRSGGRHILFRHREGIRNSESKIAPGVDVRGEGGYIVWWPGFGGAVMDTARVAEWPDWLAEMASPKVAVHHAPLRPRPIPADATSVERFVARVLFRLCTANEGERHNRLRAASCTLGGLLDEVNISESEAAQRLMGAVVQAGGSAVNQENAYKTIIWGLAKGRLSPLELGGRNAR
jgi:hypothetical protein